MHSAILFRSVAILATVPYLVSAHGKITTATGDQGGNGTGLGITAGSGNSESDVTVFGGSTLGATASGTTIDPATLIPAMELVTGSNTIPQVSASGGVVTMTYHQVNADGAGPITCSVDATGTGASFTAMTVTSNVPGTNGDSTAADEDFPLVASMPASTTCAGTVAGLSNVCLVKCTNGRFGGVVPIQQTGGATTAASATTSSTATVEAASTTAASVATTSSTTAAAAAATATAGTDSDSCDVTPPTNTMTTASNSTTSGEHVHKHHHHHKEHKRERVFANVFHA